nr:extensin-like isoform X1 [Penaeus vannamei]
MGFSAMDGFFLAVFLAVCILAAVILRCICYRCCLQSCSQKARQNNGEMILPRHTTPTITPARPQPYSQVDGTQRAAVPPQSRAVFTIYTFPQHESPEMDRSPPRTPGPPKYSSLPADAPPKYEDLFPQADFTFPSKTPSPKLAPPTRDSINLQPLRSSPQQNTLVPLAPPPVVVPPPPASHFPAPRVPSSAPSPSLPPSSPPSAAHSSSSLSDPSAEGVPREAPPTYTPVPPARDGE